MPGRSRAAYVARLIVCLAATLWGVARVRAQFVEVDYETERLLLFVKAAGLEIDPAPEGKTIAYIKYERRRVFEPDDLLIPIVLPRGLSTWPNTFHWLTEQSTVQAEVLLETHGVYSAALAEETARNLREQPLMYALVRIVALKTRDPARVGVLVYTRDLWSLRLEQEFNGVGSTFSGGANMVERNFLGRGKSLGVRAAIDPRRWSTGQTYFDPRVWGGELRLYETIDLILNRHTDKFEGGIGTFTFSRPFYNLAQTTGFELSGSYSDYVTRRVWGADVIGYSTDSAKLGDYCVPGTPNCLAKIWRDRRLQLTASVQYQIGVRHKQTFSLGAAYYDQAVRPNAETGLAASERAQFEVEVLPHVRRDVYPYLRYRLWLPRYALFTNLGTFGLSESVQLGPRINALVGVPLRAYGASSDGVILRAAMGYTYAEHDALLDLQGEVLSRVEQGNVVDQRAVLLLRGSSPVLRWLAGRMVFRVLWDARRRDTSRAEIALGGDAGLRGYEAGAFQASAPRYALGNLEYRSLPIPIQSVRIGFAVFYDVGGVPMRTANFVFHHSAGAGIRFMFPQFSTSPFRLDLGVPLGEGGFRMQFTFGSEQAIPLTPHEDLQAQSRLSGLP